eukprot:6355121-Pyramimonas_sp.AAC.1
MAAVPLRAAPAGGAAERDKEPAEPVESVRTRQRAVRARHHEVVPGERHLMAARLPRHAASQDAQGDQALGASPRSNDGGTR